MPTLLHPREALVVAFRQRVIGTGLAALRTSGLHRLAAPWTRGCGAILTFHRVLARQPGGFAPNQGLEIAPVFLDALLSHVVAKGFRLVRLDDVPGLLRSAGTSRPFLALTFDDGYRDTLTAALPILERHAAPFTTFATPGFLDRTARLWWIELELALGRLPRVQFRGREIETRSLPQKRAAFREITRALLRENDERLLDGVAGLVAQAGLSSADIADALCMDWTELARLARHPLASIGCHTLTHPRLARLPPERCRTEMDLSRSRLERELGLPIRTFCYPYGMKAAAGAREFDMAAQLGYASAVTTRPGVLFGADADRITALPRISVNGWWQDVATLDVLLSGAAFAPWGFERGRLRSTAA